jgi:hypothetical protein
MSFDLSRVNPLQILLNEELLNGTPHERKRREALIAYYRRHVSAPGYPGSIVSAFWVRALTYGRDPIIPVIDVDTVEIWSRICDDIVARIAPSGSWTEVPELHDEAALWGRYGQAAQGVKALDVAFYLMGQYSCWVSFRIAEIQSQRARLKEAPGPRQ